MVDVNSVLPDILGERDLNVLQNCLTNVTVNPVIVVAVNDTLSRFIFVHFGARFEAKPRLKHRKSALIWSGKSPKLASPGVGLAPPNATSKGDKTRLNKAAKDASHDHFTDFYDKVGEDGKKFFHFCANLARRRSKRNKPGRVSTVTTERKKKTPNTVQTEAGRPKSTAASHKTAT